jgi:hypothetical protein
MKSPNSIISPIRTTQPNPNGCIFLEKTKAARTTSKELFCFNICFGQQKLQQEPQTNQSKEQKGLPRMDIPMKVATCSYLTMLKRIIGAPRMVSLLCACSLLKV